MLTQGAVLAGDGYRFLSGVVALDSKSGLLAYGSAHRVVLLDIRGSVGGTILGLLQLSSGKNDRVTSVAFSTSVTGEDEERVSPPVLFSAAGAALYVWDCTILDGRKVNVHSGSSVTAIACADAIYSADKRGRLCRSNLGLTDRVMAQPARQEAVAVAASPHDSTMAAVGYRSGAVAVVTFVNSGNPIVRWLRAHSQDIQCLSWVPGTTAKMQLLCSSGRDKSIKLWNPITEAIVHEWQLPASRNRRGGTGKDSGKDKVWLTHCWLESNSLITTGHRGELLLWTLGPDGEPEGSPRVMSQAGPARAVFQIVKQTNDCVITIASDRQLTAWSLPSLSASWQLSTVGGYVHSLCSDGVDPSCVAIGCGDNLIRVWHADDNPAAKNAVRLFWKGISARVTVVRWHPFDEDLLAFGVEDGSVGTYNVKSDKSTLFTRQHSGVVSFLAWGPSISNTTQLTRPKQPFVVYSVASDNTLLCHAIVDQKTGPTDEAVPTFLPRPETNACALTTAIDWTRTEPFLCALGRADGTIDTYADSAEYIGTFRGHTQSVTCVKWARTKRPLLASGSDSGTVKIHDAIQQLDKLATASTDSIDQPDGTRDFALHTDKITSVCWDNRGERLISTSADKTAQVWDVALDGKSAAIRNFRRHRETVLCGAWADENGIRVITGAADNACMLWGVSEQPYAQPPEDDGRSKHRSQGTNCNDAQRVAPTASQVSTSALIQSSGPDGSGKSIDHDDSGKHKTNATDKKSSQQAPHSSGNTRRSKRAKSVLPTVARHAQMTINERQVACLQLAQLHFAKPGASPEATETSVLNSDLGLFIDGASSRLTVTQEHKGHLAAGRFDAAATLGAWRGSLVESLQAAMLSKSLTATHVAMSPQAGLDVWKQVVNAYAEQMVATGEHQEAAKYFLLSGNVHLAIQAYRSSCMYAEALALSRCRLGEKDPIILDIYKDWAVHAVGQGNFELAAKCHLVLGEPGVAVELLSKRGGWIGLSGAMQLAAEIGASPPPDLVTRFCVECRHERQWGAALSALQTESKLTPVRAVLAVEQCVDNLGSDERITSGAGGPDRAANTEWFGQFYAGTNPENIILKWQDIGLSCEALLPLQPLPAQPASLLYQGPEDRCIVLYAVGCVQQWCGNMTAAIRHWRDALIIARTNDLNDLMSLLGRLAFPDGIETLRKEPLVQELGAELAGSTITHIIFGQIHALCAALQLLDKDLPSYGRERGCQRLSSKLRRHTERLGQTPPPGVSAEWILDIIMAFAEHSRHAGNPPPRDEVAELLERYVDAVNTVREDFYNSTVREAIVKTLREGPPPTALAQPSCDQ